MLPPVFIDVCKSGNVRYMIGYRLLCNLSIWSAMLGGMSQLTEIRSAINPNKVNAISWIVSL